MVLARIAQGELEGTENEDGICRFAGIPFAAPPIGSRRWRAPEPPEPWRGRRDATAFGPIAPQADFMALLLGFEPEPQHEACLNLNVYTPGVDDRRRPVMVWIHGGAFVMGSGSTVGHDGSALAHRGDVVVVTINYRLGALGFLDLAPVDRRYADSGNVGLLDQVAALQWVHDNIGTFGGDPDNVTIFGESAGGMSVGTLLGTPAARGLFHKAIPESGAAHNASPPSHAAEITEHLLRMMKVSDINELLGLSADDIVQAQQHFILEFFTESESLLADGAVLRLPFQPVIDGVVLPRPPLDHVAAGGAAGVPVLIGTCRDEWKLFQFLDQGHLDDAVFERRLAKVFGDPAEAHDVYRDAFPDAEPIDRFGAAVTDLVFRQPAIRLCEALVANGSPTFSYLFTWSGSDLGACHALEVPFVFGPEAGGGLGLLLGDNPPAELVDVMQASWLSFARTGDPSNEFVGEWPAYDVDRRPTMLLDTPPALVADPEPERRRLWESVI